MKTTYYHTISKISGTEIVRRCSQNGVTCYYKDGEVRPSTFKPKEFRNFMKMGKKKRVAKTVAFALLKKWGHRV